MDATPNKKPILEINQAGFDVEVVQSQQPVLAAFCAPWSRPCHVLDSVLDEVAVGCAGRAKVVRINADDNPELGMWYDIQSIPTLLFFVSGALRARLVGTASKEAILAKLAAVLREGGGPSTSPPPRSV
jgi:thioredoxin 1